uniref:Reverse transcriptase Ty1/copia-type domain-containing protein n=1 Tax=Solanum lycopersicum TaxID=4081 RepID=A0A3Q7G0R6_SOLLC
MLDKDITKEVTNTDYSVSSPFVLDNIVGDNIQTPIVSLTNMHTEPTTTQSVSAPTIPTETQNEPVLRRSTRTHTVPKYLRTDLAEIESLKAHLHDQFKIKYLGKLHYFLSLEILYKDNGGLISQKKFATDLIKEFGCSNYSTTSSPLDPSVKLSSIEGTLLTDPTYYRKLVGKLNFLTNTRMDITYSVQHLSQFLQAPREPHLKAAFHVLRYLKNDLNQGIFMTKHADCTITAYCDSDLAACSDSRKSVSGYIVFQGDSPIGWKSKKQTTIYLSSAEAEYRAIRKVVGELVWLERNCSSSPEIQSSSHGVLMRY